MFFEKKDDFDSFARSLETREQRKMRRFRQAGGASAVIVLSGAVLLWISSVIGPSSGGTTLVQPNDSDSSSIAPPSSLPEDTITPFAPFFSAKKLDSGQVSSEVHQIIFKNALKTTDEAPWDFSPEIPE